MIGNYFEIGANGTVGEFLLSHGWQYSAQASQHLSDKIIESLKQFARFNGYFVEGNPDTIYQLANRFENVPNATFIEATISDQVSVEKKHLIHGGGVTLDKTTFYGDMTSFETDDYYTQYLAACIDLDTLFAKLNQYPDFLRIDIEGAEKTVLETYRFDPPPRCIVVDHHFKNHDTVLTILQNKGYTCFPHPITPEDVIGVYNAK